MQVEVTDKENVSKEGRDQRAAAFFGIIFVVILVALLVWAIISLAQAEPTTTAKIRDIFIIFMALISLFIGFALIILIVQVTSLINLLQNEIKPILDATNETVHTLRGTTTFLSENIAEPVIKLNTSLAGLRRILELIGIKRS